ncbi:translation initiation factor [Lithospermum erythrorhizon]|uniref:Translation initiation factor n=1 Tax=Lithospermum erythrorhizon TaxID=34254 RepID=A0AAV3PSH1_LITER
MAKKSKEKKKTSPNANSSTFFNTLFGSTPEDAETASIFSNSNPFKRKPSQTTPNKKPQKDAIFVENKLEFNVLNVENGSQTTPHKNKHKDVSFIEEKGGRKRGKDKEKKMGIDLIEEGVELSTKKKRKGSDLMKLEKNGILEVGLENNEGIDKEEVKKKKKKGLDSKKNQNLEVEELRKNEGIGSVDLVSNGEEVEEKTKESEISDLGNEKNKKKRKRDEIEVEYEKKLYGAVAEEENGNSGVAVGEKRKKMENLEELMVSKEGFDDEDKLLRTVFVGNLPLKIKKKVLLKEFGIFGEVESVRIRSVPLLDSKTPRKGAIMKKQINESADSVHAYIVFKTVESAQGALAHNMAVVEGNHIRVDRACPPRKKLKGDSTSLYDNKRSIFVGNLPFDVKNEELYQLFTHMKGLESSLEAVRVIRDPSSSLGKGIAYVLFKTKEAANMVFRKRVLRLRDRELRLSRVNSNSTPKKSQTVSPGKGSTSSIGSRTPGSNMQNDKVTMSYQGLRASKSGISKKTSTNTGRRVNLNVTNQKPKEAIVDRKRKRPSVAARKAKALKLDSALKAAGTKRKLGNQTPESAYQKKKFRRN